MLVFWLVISALCQLFIDNERHATWVRFVWSALDPTVLTAILWIAHAFISPLVILYLAVVAASGFWFRVSLVFTATASSLLGYLILLAAHIGRHEPRVPFHWHLLAFVSMVVTGLSVAYLVNRVSALTRFYERHPLARP